MEVSELEEHTQLERGPARSNFEMSCYFFFVVYMGCFVFFLPFLIGSTKRAEEPIQSSGSAAQDTQFVPGCRTAVSPASKKDRAGLSNNRKGKSSIHAWVLFPVKQRQKGLAAPTSAPFTPTTRRWKEPATRGKERVKTLPQTRGGSPGTTEPRGTPPAPGGRCRARCRCRLTCRAVGAVLAGSSRLAAASLPPVVVAGALVEARFGAGAAVAEGAAAAADGGVAAVEAFGALEAVPPAALPVQPTVAILAAGRGPRRQQPAQRRQQQPAPPAPHGSAEAGGRAGQSPPSPGHRRPTPRGRQQPPPPPRCGDRRLLLLMLRAAPMGQGRRGAILRPPGGRRAAAAVRPVRRRSRHRR